MDMTNKTISAIDEKIAQLKARKARIEAVEKTRRAKAERAADTRRKILLGAYLLDEMKRDTALDLNIRKQLDGWLNRPDDRILFELGIKNE